MALTYSIMTCITGYLSSLSVYSGFKLCLDPRGRVISAVGCPLLVFLVIDVKLNIYVNDSFAFDLCLFCFIV